VRLFNRSTDKYERFANTKAVTCASPAQAASGADVVISMVSNDSASIAVWHDPGGALETIGAGAVVVESSTVSLQRVRELSEAVERKGAHFLDAPVTGSKNQAIAGALKFLVGGDQAVVDNVRPVLAAMSTDTILLGPVGSGTAFKLVNNFICGVQVAALAEGLAMLSAFNLDKNIATNVLAKGAAGSPILQVVLERHAAGDFTPNFAAALMLKDLDYAINDASRNGVTLLTAEAARQRFSEAVAAGNGEKDIASLLLMFRP
jgi:3-hydroxyisobutyrate dehydrogenase